MQLLVAINGTSAASPTVAFSFSLLVSPACPPACRPRMCCACVHVLLAPALGRSKSNVGYGRAPLGRLISNTTHRPKCNCLCSFAVAPDITARRAFAWGSGRGSGISKRLKTRRPAARIVAETDPACANCYWGNGVGRGSHSKAYYHSDRFSSGWYFTSV